MRQRREQEQRGAGEREGKERKNWLAVEREMNGRRKKNKRPRTVLVCCVSMLCFFSFRRTACCWLEEEHAGERGKKKSEKEKEREIAHGVEETASCLSLSLSTTRRKKCTLRFFFFRAPLSTLFQLFHFRSTVLLTYHFSLFLSRASFLRRSANPDGEGHVSACLLRVEKGH